MSNKRTLMEMSRLSKRWNYIVTPILFNEITLPFKSLTALRGTNEKYRDQIKVLKLTNLKIHKMIKDNGLSNLDLDIENNYNGQRRSPSFIREKDILISLYEFIGLEWPSIHTVIIDAQQDKLFMSNCLNIISGSFPKIKSMTIMNAGNITGLHLWMAKKHPKLENLKLVGTFDSRLSFSQLFSSYEAYDDKKPTTGLSNLTNLKIENINLSDDMFEKLSNNKKIKTLNVSNSTFEPNTVAVKKSEVSERSVWFQTQGIETKTLTKTAQNQVVSLDFSDMLPIDSEYVLRVNSQSFPNLEEFGLSCAIFPHDGKFFDMMFKKKFDSLKRLVLPTINDKLASEISLNCPNLTSLTIVANGSHSYEFLEFTSYGLNSLLSKLSKITNIEISTGCFTSKKPIKINDGLLTYYDYKNWASTDLRRFSIKDAYFSAKSIAIVLNKMKSLIVFEVSLKNAKIYEDHNELQTDSGFILDNIRFDSVRLKKLLIYCSTSSSFERLAEIIPFSHSFESFTVYYSEIKRKYAEQLNSVPNLYLRRRSFC
ncbi:hypothetical protein AYI70_g9533 [Smittium culicis]|uniref:F-box domain-containing protein n=1 Tax=Smittium culicis TaxID=133412 RepID=A0A1R1XAR9_9FUNG|nr:hypothetical protein AYI70_g9533 [Smittium culicis]